MRICVSLLYELILELTVCRLLFLIIECRCLIGDFLSHNSKLRSSVSVSFDGFVSILVVMHG